MRGAGMPVDDWSKGSPPPVNPGAGLFAIATARPRLGAASRGAALPSLDPLSSIADAICAPPSGSALTCIKPRLGWG